MVDPRAPLAWAKQSPSPHTGKQADALLTQLAEFRESYVALICSEGYKEGIGVKCHSLSFISMHNRHKIALSRTGWARVLSMSNRVLCQHLEAGIVPSPFLSFSANQLVAVILKSVKASDCASSEAFHVSYKFSIRSSAWKTFLDSIFSKDPTLVV